MKENLILEKFCAKCHILKSLSEFHKSKGERGNRACICKDCRKKMRYKSRPNYPPIQPHFMSKFQEDTCNILQKHVSELEEDPNRLTTSFIRSLINIEDKCEDIKD